MTQEDEKSSAVTSPHDRLVKSLLANTNQAREIIEVYLPKFSKAVGDEVMSLGQQAIREAAKQAKLNAFQETALRMLDEKCDLQLISRVTHLSQEEIKQLIKKKSN